MVGRVTGLHIRKMERGHAGLSNGILCKVVEDGHNRRAFSGPLGAGKNKNDDVLFIL